MFHNNKTPICGFIYLELLQLLQLQAALHLLDLVVQRQVGHRRVDSLARLSAHAHYVQPVDGGVGARADVHRPTVLLDKMVEDGGRGDHLAGACPRRPLSAPGGTRSKHGRKSRRSRAPPCRQWICS